MNTEFKQMKEGDKARIVGYKQGSGAYRQKLLSMGLTKDTEITLVKYAPMGDPVKIEVRGFKLSLRKSEADILVLEEV